MDDRDEVRGPALFVVVGLPGSGKTTRARALAAEYGAVRLNPDEWMIDLGVDLFDEPFRARLEQRMTLPERNQRPGEAHIDRATLDGYLPRWHRPTADELATYDPHPTNPD